MHFLVFGGRMFDGTLMGMRKYKITRTRRDSHLAFDSFARICPSIVHHCSQKYYLWGVCVKKGAKQGNRLKRFISPKSIPPVEDYKSINDNRHLTYRQHTHIPCAWHNLVDFLFLLVSWQKWPQDRHRRV